MGTKYERPHWTSLAARGGDVKRVKSPTNGMPSLEDVLDEFKHCFGEQIGIDLSEASETKFKLLTLTKQEADQLFDSTHPHLKLEDFPDEDAVDFDATGPQDVTIGTARLQGELENFFFGHLPSLIDQKKISMVVDDGEMNGIVVEIQRILSDYKVAGLLPKTAQDISTTDLRGMLEVAFGDAVEFYRPRRTATTEHSR